MGLDRDQVSRHKKVVVQQQGDHVHEEHIVQDTNLELRQTVYKVTQLVWLLFGILEGLIWVIFYRSPTSQVTTYDRDQGL